jgi:excinuclease ABC subunit C
MRFVDLGAIPRLPGVYLMRDAAARIIYIGKAVNLADRIRSYFHARRELRPVSFLMGTVRSIDYIVCGSESEALVLEQHLINLHQPVGNVQWRDDKSYPYLALTREPFPRLTVVRRRIGTTDAPRERLFGPYPDVRGIRALAVWLRRSCGIRSCGWDSTDFPVRDERRRRRCESCIYRQTGCCCAPCLGGVSRREYNTGVRRAVVLLTGRRHEFLERLRARLAELAAAGRYEEAIVVRDAVRGMENVLSRCLFREVACEEVLAAAVRGVDALNRIKHRLHLRTLPAVIDGVDISTTGGGESVGSAVRFVNGVPEHRSYRRYRIRTVTGQDDFAMIHEVVLRRYRRLAAERAALPQLLLVDGGRGQMDAAAKALGQLGLSEMIELAALVKEREEVYRPGCQRPVSLENEPGDLILRHVRDEAHRCAVGYHRIRRRARLFGGGG